MADINSYKSLKKKKRMTPENHKKYIVKRIWIICFLFLVLSHILDMITTVIGMSLGAVESNPVSAYFFNLGWYGYVLSDLYVMSIFIVIFAFVALLPKLYKKMTYQEPSVALIAALFIIFTANVFVGKIMAVVNNIFVIIRIW